MGEHREIAIGQIKDVENDLDTVIELLNEGKDVLSVTGLMICRYKIECIMKTIIEH